MATTHSFAVPCPCRKCKGKPQHLVRVKPGVWKCPESGETVAINQTEEARAKRDLQNYKRGTR
jgi:ribosomal protein L37AE/L43A